MKRILVVGNGKSGSWKIRGEQLGAAIGATVDPFAEKGVKGFDLAVVVKRTRPEVLQRLRAAGVPLVYDIVDGWPQPSGNEWGKDQCLKWLKGAVGAMNPVAVMCATRQMTADCTLVSSAPCMTLHHHYRPGIRRNDIRKHVSLVGYEGNERYLGKWRPVLEKECAKRGWKFVVNPNDLADLDIVVALRDCEGWAGTKWKSNVKLANAHGSGTPFVGSVESGYRETGCDHELWAVEHKSLSICLDKLTPFGYREEVSQHLYAARIPLEDVAKRYRAWLETL